MMRDLIRRVRPIQAETLVMRVVLGEKRAAQAKKDFKKGVVPGAVATPAKTARATVAASETSPRRQDAAR